MENKNVREYINLKKKMNGVVIKGLEKYNISSALTIQLWKSVTRSDKAIALRTLGLLIHQKIKVIEVMDKSTPRTALLYTEPVPLRKDNMQIFDNATSFMEPCNMLRVELCSVFSCIWFLKKIVFFIKCMGKFREFSLKEKLYFAASSAVVYEIDEKFKKSEIMNKTKLLMVFQDHEMVQNLAVQYVKNNGGIAVSLQHGQRVFRKIDADYMAFDNFISDYTLLWNKFSQNQYLKAGYDIARLPIVGATKYANVSFIDIEKENNNLVIDENKIVLGVVLNAPSQFGFDEITKTLLKWAQDYANKYDCSVVVKIHPTDDKKNYDIYTNSRISIADSNMSMVDFADEITCGIGHASGALVDLIILNKPIFLYSNEIAFPLELPDENKFTSYEEMEKKIRLELELLKKNPQKFYKIRDLYYEENANSKHRKFFEGLKVNL